MPCFSMFACNVGWFGYKARTLHWSLGFSVKGLEVMAQVAVTQRMVMYICTCRLHSTLWPHLKTKYPDNLLPSTITFGVPNPDISIILTPKDVVDHGTLPDIHNIIHNQPSFPSCIIKFGHSHDKIKHTLDHKLPYLI